MDKGDMVELVRELAAISRVSIRDIFARVTICLMLDLYETSRCICGRVHAQR